MISLYSAEDLQKEASKYGNFTNAFGQSFPKITVVFIQEILEGLRLNLPLALEIVKNAEKKTRNYGKFVLISKKELIISKSVFTFTNKQQI